MDEQTYWDKQHDKYLATDWIDKPSMFAEWVTQYFPNAGTLLDLGAGQAQDSRYFAGKGYAVTSTDFSAHAIELAEQKPTAGITFKQVDLSHLLPFENESYDIIYAHLSLHYFDAVTTAKLFEEIHRVLKPGGVLAALFNTNDDPEIAEGEQIEPDYILLDGIRKRYFSPDSARDFAEDFEVILADDKGTTYKDNAKGINNLIRLVAKKS
jgi:SAM-dependent methyltransferase